MGYFYSAVWRPGTGSQFWYSGLKPPDFKAQAQNYAAQGLRVRLLDVVKAPTLTASPSITVVYAPGSGAQEVETLPPPEFTERNGAYEKKGLRLTKLSWDGFRYTGVWRFGLGKQEWTKLEADAFRDEDDAHYDDDLRLRDLDWDGEYLTGVWRPGSGAQRWEWSISPRYFLKRNQHYRDEGCQLTTFRTAHRRITALWRAGSGTETMRIGLADHDFKEQDQDFFDHGLRLTALAVSLRPVIVYRLPFDDDPAWEITRGNWDDPIAGHAKGDPDTPQAYAYDFAFIVTNRDGESVGAEGKNVRAARSGVVREAIDHYTANTWGKGPGDPDYDSTPGCGNLVVIDHGDGTAAGYCHLQHKKVFVEKDDVVAQGDLLGLTGNTGDSSTPHLHFDVFVDLTGKPFHTIELWFEDKDHLEWRPRVGDALRSNNS